MDYPVVVREATVEDRIALWDWRNESSFKPVYKVDPSVMYRHHRLWFDQILHSEEIVLCIGLVEILRIGCVLFAMQSEGEYEIATYLKPQYCGKGLGASMLRLSVHYLEESRHVSRLFTAGKKVNPSSGEIFRQVGFQVQEDESTLYFESVLNGKDCRSV